MRGIINWFTRELLSREAANVAKGKHGERVRSWYWWAAGRKRLWAWSLWVGAYVIAAAAGVGCDPASAAVWATATVCARTMWASEVLQAVAGALLALGIVDKDWRSPKQKPPEAIAGATLYAGLTGAVLYGINAALLGMGAEWAQQTQIVLEGVVIPTLVLTGVASVPARLAEQRRG